MTLHTANGRVRRTISAWGTEPRDGTPFHILTTLRFNPLAEQMEILCHGDDGTRCWQRVNFAEGHDPTMWVRRVPLPYDIPTSFAFTWTYEVRPKNWRERLMDRLFRCTDGALLWSMFHDAAGAFGARK